jgi:hypothetical protein
MELVMKTRSFLPHAALILALVSLGCGGKGGHGFGLGADSGPGPGPTPGPTPSTGDFTGDFLGWTGSDDSDHYFKFVRMDGTTGEVTNIGGTRYFRDLEYGPDGLLYGIGSSLYTIDPATGIETLIGGFDTSTEKGILMGGGAFSPSGTLYVRRNMTDEIYTVNLANGKLTYVGTPTALIEDLAFAADGTLYASFAALYTLDPATAATVREIGRISGSDYIGTMDFGDSGVLYGMDIYPSTTLYTVDTVTAKGASVVPVQSTGICALVAERARVAPRIAASAIPQAAAPTDDEMRAMEVEAKADCARHRNPAR